MKKALDEMQWGRVRCWMENPGNLAILAGRPRNQQALLLGMVVTGREIGDLASEYFRWPTQNVAVSYAILDEALRMWSHLAGDAPGKPGHSGPVHTDPAPRTQP